MLGHLYEKQMLSWRFSVEGFLGKAPRTTALTRKVGKQNHDVIGTEATENFWSSGSGPYLRTVPSQGKWVGPYIPTLTCHYMRAAADKRAYMRAGSSLLEANNKRQLGESVPDSWSESGWHTTAWTTLIVQFIYSLIINLDTKDQLFIFCADWRKCSIYCNCIL